jgi:hypothetical protein
MDRVEQNQSNEDVEAVLRAAEDLGDETLLRAASEVGGPPGGARPFTFSYPCRDYAPRVIRR